MRERPILPRSCATLANESELRLPWSSSITSSKTASRRGRRNWKPANRQLQSYLQQLESKTDELRSTSQQLWQSAKLASVGELAASIAHELNNPLGTVSLRIESILAQTEADDPRRKALEIVEQEVERMANLVANLLQFSRHGREQISTVNVEEEIRMTVELDSAFLETAQHRDQHSIRGSLAGDLRRPPEASTSFPEPVHQRRRRHDPGRQS